MKQLLENLKEKNLYRELVESDVVDSVVVRRGDEEFISFASNDFLGLAHDELVKWAAIAAIEESGVGAGASRYVTGNNSLYTRLEKEIARFKGCDDAIVFSSGYAGAIGVIPALVGEGDLILGDKLIHSSLLDGAKLSGAKLMRFLHNDLSHARKILQENRDKFKKCLIVTETVFSMDGDLGDVDGLLELAGEFDCVLLSDDAHGLWMDWHERVGAVADHAQHPLHSPLQVARQMRAKSLMLKSEKRCQVPFYIQIGTLSKAVGALGGYVAADGITIDYLRNFAKSAIYSTALPPAILAASLTAIKIIKEKNPGEKALENARYFCELMKLPQPQSAIVVMVIGDNKKVLDIAFNVKEKGFLISAIRPPTVEPGKSRLRITFSAMHQKQQIEELAKIISQEVI